MSNLKVNLTLRKHGNSGPGCIMYIVTNYITSDINVNFEI